MMSDVILMLLGCASLYLGGDGLIRGCTALGRRLHMSPLLIGLVLVAFGTSAPELAVSLDAAIRSHGDLAAGNVVGSNMVNAALALLVLGIVARLPPVRSLAERDLPFLLLLSLLTALMLLDQHLSRWEGAALLLATAAFLGHVLRARQLPPACLAAPPGRRAALWKSVLFALGGIGLLVVGGEAMVHSGIGIARALGVSEAIIAMTVTAVGTGVPEISATLIALWRGHAALALGNLVGSNIMNLGIVLGSSSLVAPLQTPGMTLTPLSLLLVLTLTTWVGLLWQGRQLDLSRD